MNKKFAKGVNAKRRYEKRYKKSFLNEVFYNYSQKPQRYGVGTTSLKLEAEVTVAANSTETYQATFNTLEAMSNFEQYKYAKLQLIGVAQDAVNYPDEPGKCYVTIGYGNKALDTNVEISDSVKIFKNVGANFFKYLPINAITRQTYFTSGSSSEVRYVAINQFNDTDVLKDFQAKWRLPFKLYFKNDTAKSRKFRVITKVLLKGREAEGLTRFIAEQIKQAAEKKVMIDEGCDPIEFENQSVEDGTQTDKEEDVKVDNKVEQLKDIKASNKVEPMNKKQKKKNKAKKSGEPTSDPQAIWRKLYMKFSEYYAEHGKIDRGAIDYIYLQNGYTIDPIMEETIDEYLNQHPPTLTAVQRYNLRQMLPNMSSQEFQDFQDKHTLDDLLKLINKG